MRSKDVAELAGVSVRTLRHYHQIGLLPEPHRGTNGYRDYGLGDVALLLRIRRLVEVGLSLDQVAHYLDDVESSADAFLDDLDRSMKARIEVLQAQRTRIAALRDAGHHRPDLPPEPGLAPVTASADLAALERDAWLILAQLLGDHTGPELDDLAATTARAGATGELADIVDRFEALPASASHGDVEKLVADYMTLLGPGVREFLASAAGARLHGSDALNLHTVFNDPRLNAPQTAALELLASRLV